MIESDPHYIPLHKFAKLWGFMPYHWILFNSQSHNQNGDIKMALVNKDIKWL